MVGRSITVCYFTGVAVCFCFVLLFVTICYFEFMFDTVCYFVLLFVAAQGGDGREVNYCLLALALPLS